MPFDPARAIADLRAIAELTGGHGTGGARRVCWTDEWMKARAYVHDQLAATGAEIDRDEAGNVWAYLRGVRRRDGDRRLARRLGAERRLAGRRAGHRRRARGAARDRRGRHAAVHRRVRRLRGRGGRALRPQPVRLLGRLRLPGAGGARRPARPRRPAASRTCCASTASRSTACWRRAAASTARAPTSSCTSSRGRCSSPRASPSARCSARSASSGSARTSSGQAAHAGSTPIRQRRDSFLAAARTALELREIALRHDGVCTVGDARLRARRRHGRARPRPRSWSTSATSTPTMLAAHEGRVRRGRRAARRARRAARSRSSRSGGSSRSRSTTA